MQRIAQRLRRREENAPVLGHASRRPAERHVGVDGPAARRPVGVRRAEHETPKMRVGNADAAVRHDAVRLVSRIERDATHAAERIAVVEEIVEVFEVDARRSEVRRLCARGNGTVETEHRRTDRHVAVLGFDRADSTGKCDGRVVKIQAIKRSFGHRNIALHVRRRSRPGDCEIRIERALGV
jgi:hypothetical protein